MYACNVISYCELLLVMSFPLLCTLNTPVFHCIISLLYETQGYRKSRSALLATLNCKEHALATTDTFTLHVSTPFTRTAENDPYRCDKLKSIGVNRALALQLICDVIEYQTQEIWFYSLERIFIRL